MTAGPVRGPEALEKGSPAFAWAPAERELFFEAIARHRRAAWRVSLASGSGAVILTVVMAVLLAPLLWSVVGLAFDVVNLAIPMPDVLGIVGRLADRLTDGTPAPPAVLARGLALAALPGLLVMAVVALALRRAVFALPLFNAGDVVGRAPDPTLLEEVQVANVVEEMAVAAGIPPPHVRLVPAAMNAAALGRDAERATVLIGEGLLVHLDRDQTQGAIAHLIGSIADGDMEIGLRAAGTLALFSLMARLTTTLSDRDAWKRTLRLVRSLVFPTAASSAWLMEELSDPMKSDPSPAAAAPGASDPARLTWREWAMMPLMGPLVISGFLAGIVSTFILTPLVSLAWRQRKHMADATAVRLTRDPNALARALGALASGGGSTTLAPWVSHLAVVGTGRDAGASIVGTRLMDVFPPSASRERALQRMGAAARPIAPSAWGRMPLWARVVVGALLATCFVLGAVVIVLLTWLSAALSMLFTLLPAAILHAILRSLGR